MVVTMCMNRIWDVHAANEMTEHTFGGVRGSTFVSFVFLSCSQSVLFSMIFLKFSMYSFKVFPIGPHFILYPFTKVLPFSPIYIYIYVNQIRGTPNLHKNRYFWGELTSFNLSFFFGWWAPCKKTKSWIFNVFFRNKNN